MDIVNSPGAQAGRHGPAARKRGSQAQRWHSGGRGGLDYLRVCSVTHSGDHPGTRV